MKLIVKNQKKIIYSYKPFVTLIKENFKNKFQSRKNFHQIKLQNATMVILENQKNQILFLNEYRRGIKKKSLGFPGGHIEEDESPLKVLKESFWKKQVLKQKNGSFFSNTQDTVLIIVVKIIYFQLNLTESLKEKTKKKLKKNG